MIDRYEAPNGYVAFNGSENVHYCSERHKCLSRLRADEESVIFKTRADFEKMLLAEIEAFYGKGKVKRIIFTKDNIK